MKRADKRQAEEVVSLLKRTHTLIRKMLGAGNHPAAMELLEQCQGCAISLGEQIEATEGENFPTISLLENYCELVYQIYERVSRSVSVNANQIHNGLARELIRIQNSIRLDIPARTEVVFLPYKASMWDSLESIWQAADEDPECDAYVVPIPYYEKNPDGSLGKLHYEGSLYPEYVPITYYQDYEIAMRQPDMIFIHNPYDNNNYLTSVHPFFYASNLKQFTEKLVYVPYFVLQEPDPDNPAEVENISPFCTTPGVVYADQVIVQSEKMRQVYIKVMTEFTAGRGLDRAYWEKKILGLGSPKMDKVLHTKKEDQEIPEDWLRIIVKPDGSFKKVIFYNTGLTAFLQNSEPYLKKMKDVFRVFWEERNDVALLWRPHPLFANTVKSMRPQLWAEYESLEEEYRRGGWGIYDDSADLNRAIAVCDAYYGDGSSVVQLCQEAGKAVMIQDVGVLTDSDEKETDGNSAEQ